MVRILLLRAIIALPGHCLTSLAGDIPTSTPQDTRVRHRRRAGPTSARRVADLADMSHSSHYDPTATRAVFNDVSLNCDDGSTRPRRDLRMTFVPFRT